MGVSLLSCFSCFTTHTHASSRLKTDVVMMKNGDRITCEIRSLEQGQLTVKQEYANSTVAFDWNKVAYIQTRQPFVVVDNRGDAFSGLLSETADQHVLSVGAAGKREIPHNEVVSIELRAADRFAHDTRRSARSPPNLQQQDQSFIDRGARVHFRKRCVK
jgi:hypothetical protein